MLNILTTPLGYIMSFCYRLSGSYAASIVLFALITKALLMPVSLWVHRNGIRMVALMPDLNRIKVRYFGDGDRIADETQALYKQAGYNPLASLVPLFLQIALLVGLIQVIYNPLTHLLRMDRGTFQTLASAVCELTGANPESASLQLQSVQALQDVSYHDALVSLSALSPSWDRQIAALNLTVSGLNLGKIPSEAGGIFVLVPLAAGMSALLLCLFQGKKNPLQAEQGTFEGLGTMAVSVGISLILGFFVPAGVGFYWVISNLFTMIQQLFLNQIIPPGKFIDYAALSESKKELEALEHLGSRRRWYEHDPNARREKEDYKRFFSIANKHVVFYSEGIGFYKYFERLMNYLLAHSNLTLHYITSDPKDQIFGIAETEKRIRPYYISEKKLITLMMKMDADIVIMTMPDLENFHIKRSYVRQDIEYIYMFHWCTSTHMVIREGALDHYDTVFCPGPRQVEEIRFTETRDGLPAKNLLETSYGVIENLAEAYGRMETRRNARPQILIAPSYQVDNLMDTCVDGLLEQLLGKGYRVIVRPHPQYIRRAPQKIEAFAKRYENELAQGMFEFQTDFSSGDTVYQSDLVITDWSTISYEFSFTTMRPTLFINTPPKIVNPRYKEYPMEPLDLTLRNQIGRALDLNEIPKTGETVRDILEHGAEYEQQILELRNKLMPRFGESAQIGGKYILSRLMAKKKAPYTMEKRSAGFHREV
ncbi:membrane protein insertase YidC [bacterium 1XD42-94]|nr:membrane protein insertase YidC [bacterium 1XD42-76]NBK05487.1 membrane protein insertase YidC [bacterium 1XD42-94]